MMQQINLYLPELQPSKEWLTANTILFSSLGFMVLMLIAQIIINIQLSHYEEQVAMIEEQQAQATERLTKVSSIPKPVSSQKLADQIKKMRIGVKNREQVRAIIGDQNLGNATGFSMAMEAIARQSSTDISLEKFRLSRGGQLAEMGGLTVRPESIPLYLKKLGREPSFTSTRFGLLSLLSGQRSPKSIGNKSIIHFLSGYENILSTADTSDIRTSTYKKIIDFHNGSNKQ